MSFWSYYDMFKSMGYDDVLAEERANDLAERDIEEMLERKRYREEVEGIEYEM